MSISGLPGSTRRLSNFLIERVKEKIPAFDEHTTFKQFQEAGISKPLKVFATDLSGNALQSFGENRDDDRVSVVQAVVSSAAFPLFFWPGRVLGGCLTDGGVACNLPVFSFDRELDERSLPVIAFDLTWADPPKEGRLRIRGFLIRPVTASVRSHQAIVETSQHAVSIRDNWSKEVDGLNFSLTYDDRKKPFAAGTDAAKAFLELESVRPLSVQAGSLIQDVQASMRQSDWSFPSSRLLP